MTDSEVLQYLVSSYSNTKHINNKAIVVTEHILLTTGGKVTMVESYSSSFLLIM